MYIQWNISHKMEKFESDVVRWMNLEPVIQSEVSQKEKNKYHILMRMCESRKMALVNIFSGQEQRPRCRKWTWGLSGIKRRWDELRQWHCH